MMFQGYYEEVCRHIMRYVPNPRIAEDVAQDMFGELWSKRTTIEINTSVGAYLHRMAVSRSLNYIRDNRKHLHSSDEGLLREEADIPRQDDILAASELEEVIMIAIDNLPLRCRQVFMLSRFDNMTYQEIASTMDISVKTVENQMIKALKTLRQTVSAFQRGQIGDDL